MRTDQKLFCLKCSFVVFMVLLWMLGAVIFGVLLWLRLDFWSNEYTKVDEELVRYLILLYIFLVVGGLIVGFGILGIVAALKSIKWAIAVFLVALVLAILLTIGGLTYGFIYRVQLKDTLERGTLVRDFIQKRYRGIQYDRATYIINIMQSELKCCGGTSPFDYNDSTWQKQKQTAWEYRTPLSCCKDYERYLNSEQRFTETCPIYDKLSNKEKEQNSNMNFLGCGEALAAFFSRYIFLIAGIAIATLVVEIVTLILISVLLKVLTNLYVPQPQDLVYDMAHNQEKSPYPSRGDYRDHYR